jgi:hypothetical protein
LKRYTSSNFIVNILLDNNNIDVLYYSSECPDYRIFDAAQRGISSALQSP